MQTFRVATWQTEYKKAYIDAKTTSEAEAVALQSLQGERDDVDWDVFDNDGGHVEEIEAC